MPESIEITVVKYDTGLYPNFPSDFEATTANPDPEDDTPLNFIAGSAEEVKAGVTQLYRDKFAAYQEALRWNKLKDTAKTVEVTRVEL